LTSPKVMSAYIRAQSSANLCFEADGILGQSALALGSNVHAFDFVGFHHELSNLPTWSPDESRLLYDSGGILNRANAFQLAALRSDVVKATLQKALIARQNAYLTKYSHGVEIVERTKSAYSPLTTGSKPQRLARLAALSDEQARLLAEAYSTDDRLDVVRNTSSLLFSHSNTDDASHSQGKTFDESLSADYIKPDQLIADLQPGGAEVARGFTGPRLKGMTLHAASTGSDAVSRGATDQIQEILNTEFGYRVPFIESQAQNERAQVSLLDEQFATRMANLGESDLTRILMNEMESIDLDVLRLQIAYLNTILLSPIDGIVTGIYKHPGEAVKAGESVARVENLDSVHLVCLVKSLQSVHIGSSITLNAQPAIGGPVGPKQLQGTVGAVRGGDTQDLWEVVATCSNLASNGQPMFPLGYSFDQDLTTVLFS
jgi:biotin carboxyl carrier protein